MEINPRVNLHKNELGLALPVRRKRFEDLQAEAANRISDNFRIANFKGDTISLPILRVEINLPKYRIANGRTSSIQEEWVANKNLDEGYFLVGDPEVYDLQAAQHEILKEMISEEGLLEKFTDSKNTQTEPILLDHNGFVINGNRRLCCWRELFSESPSTYRHFSHVDIVVLPSCDEKELDALESRLQIEKDIRSDYSWHAEAAMFKEKQRRFGYSTSELAKHYNKKKKDIEDLFAIRELGYEYLAKTGKKNQWSLLKETEHSFRRLNDEMRKKDKQDDKELLKKIAFSFIEHPDTAGERLYAFIPKISTYLPRVKADLRNEFIKPSENGETKSENPFGSTSGANENGNDYLLLQRIDETDLSAIKSQEIIVSAVASERAKSSEQDKAKFFTDQLKKAQTALSDAVNLGRVPETNLVGADQQIKQIEDLIGLAKEFVKSREK